ncbi:MAG: hypothetical protein NTU76_02010 [Candidatus Taylorbacteria bacterium]|nr:hypothetical protein [Candidatus Taylorbacteria bacterium]
MNNKSKEKTILTCPNDHSVGRVSKSTTGFAMLFAVLISSFLIMIGISIFSISLKEVMISTSIRDSQTAFYAADSAGECALYWDIKGVGKNSVFPSCLNETCATPSTDDSPKITCNGIEQQLFFVKNSSTYSYSGNNFFKYSSSTIDTEPEADIIISKTFNNTLSKIITTFDIKGHNTGESGRRVERGITRSY